jgi:hypothetical protein
MVYLILTTIPGRSQMGTHLSVCFGPFWLMCTPRKHVQTLLCLFAFLPWPAANNQRPVKTDEFCLFWNFRSLEVLSRCSLVPGLVPGFGCVLNLTSLGLVPHPPAAGSNLRHGDKTSASFWLCQGCSSFPYLYQDFCPWGWLTKLGSLSWLPKPPKWTPGNWVLRREKITSQFLLLLLCLHGLSSAALCISWKQLPGP